MFWFNKVKNEFNALPQVSPEHITPLTRGLTLSHGSQAPLLKTCLLIGGLYSENKGLHYRDRALIRKAFINATNLGFDLSDSLDLRIANLHDGHDYNSRHAYQADLVAICCIPKNGVKKAQRLRIHPSWQISPYGNKPEKWQSSLQKRQPMLAVSSEAKALPAEITVWDACPKSYQKIPPQDFPVPVRRDCEPNVLTMHAIVRCDIAPKLSL